ncbi:MAG: helix-turn-helix transcriptional regulator [SAR324 cluster bacterium]|nr:helix-turn-helix transcriptional regulator [SAR324 cluster bacterium]
MAKFKEIISRVEEVRMKLGLNKSQFSSRIGMKPQTYNNFVGSQGSKPNIELIHGIIREFKIAPAWLLLGTGEQFSSAAPEAIYSPLQSAQMPSEGGTRGDNKAEGLSALRKELDLMLSGTRTRTTLRLSSSSHPHPQVEHAIQVITHFFLVSPEATAGRVMDMLAEFSQLAAEMEWVSNRSSSSVDQGA